MVTDIIKTKSAYQNTKNNLWHSFKYKRVLFYCTLYKNVKRNITKFKDFKKNLRYEIFADFQSNLCYNNDKAENIYGGQMSQYLSKEEIKQWRSSLEKITLEEYAKKLGKVLQEDKKTSDIIDIVMKNEKRLFTSRENKNSKDSVLNAARNAQNLQDEILETNQNSLFNSIKSQLNCKKPLTQREDAILAHFIENKGEIVYAKDLAVILNLPTDYVYKYIKNLRTKISQDILQNAAKGGYIFNM